MSSDPRAWTIEQVGQWLDEQGFSVYKDCFVANFVTGRKLADVDASRLPNLGVREFTDIKVCVCVG